jgi:hypothetical protein
VNELAKAKGVIEPARRKDNNFSGRLRCGSMRTRSRALRGDSDFHRIIRVASQRFDGPFTNGCGREVEVAAWRLRKPYMLSYESIVRKGDSGVLEVPISTFI